MTERRDKVARGVELGAGTVAGTVGTALGATKLRDAYIADYRPHFERQAAVAAKHGGRLVRVATHGNPAHFIPLAVGAGAAGLTAGAGKYRKHRERTAPFREYRGHARTVAKSVFGVDHGTGLTGRRRKRVGGLRAVDQFDDQVRGVKRELIPTAPDIISRVSAAGHEAQGRMRAQLNKP